MVRTGARASALVALLRQAGLKTGNAPPAGPRLSDLDDVVAESIIEMYRAFGGVKPDPVLRPGAWDLVVGDQLLLELDEELHFNRYRLATLGASWAQSLPWHSDYLDFCTAEESICLSAGSWGKRWTNPSCEAMFGPAAQPGDISGGGSPRWKQRALYDSVKDGYAARSGELRVARVSVHDRVGDSTLGLALAAGKSADLDSLVALIRHRTI